MNELPRELTWIIIEFVDITGKIMLKSINSFWRDMIMRVCGEIKINICEAAAVDGHLCLLERFLNVGMTFSLDVIVQTVKGGHMDVLQWLHTNPKLERCTWHKKIVETAIINGYFDIFIWLLENKYDYVYNYALRFAIINNGDVDEIVPRNTIILCFDWAIISGHVHIVEHLFSEFKNLLLPLRYMNYTRVGKSGSIEMFNYVKTLFGDEKYDYSNSDISNVCYGVVKEGHLPLLKVLIEKYSKCLLNNDLFYHVVDYKQYDILLWLIENYKEHYICYLKSTRDVLIRFSGKEDIQLISLLLGDIKKYFPSAFNKDLDCGVFGEFISRNRLDAIKLLYEYYPNIDVNDIETAISTGNLEILDFLFTHTKENKNLWSGMYGTAIASNKLEVVKWLRIHKIPWNRAECISISEECEESIIRIWILDQPINV